MEIIRTEELGKTYVKGKILIPALQGISFSISQGDFFSIVGKSGSGKSTLLNLIGGLDRPTAGRLLFQGRDLAAYSRKDLAYHRAHGVGMIFQSFNLIHSRTALENIILALSIGGTPHRRRKQRAMDLLRQVGLQDRADHKPDELSGGEAQRTAIARALANEPSVLLADEPTGNLDSQTAAEVIGILEELNRVRGLTVIMVTHDQETARRVSGNLIRLRDGGIVESTQKNSS